MSVSHRIWQIITINSIETASISLLYSNELSMAFLFPFSQFPSFPIRFMNCLFFLQHTWAAKHTHLNMTTKWNTKMQHETQNQAFVVLKRHIDQFMLNSALFISDCWSKLNQTNCVWNNAELINAVQLWTFLLNSCRL